LIRKFFIFPQKDNLSELQGKQQDRFTHQVAFLRFHIQRMRIFGGCHGEIGGTLVGIELDDPRRALGEVD